MLKKINLKFYLTRIVLSLFLIIPNTSILSAQSPVEDRTIELYESKDWESLNEYTETQLKIDTAGVFDILLLRFYRTHALINTGKIRDSYLETEKIFNEYSDEVLVDTPMVKLMLNVCQKLSYEAIEAKRLDTGLKAVKRGLQLCKDRVSNDLPRLSDLCFNAASIYRSLDSIDVALKYLNEGKEVAQKLEGKEKRTKISMLRNEEAIIYWTLNNLKMTKSIFTEELQQAIEDTNYNLQTRFHTNLGITNELLFDFGKAEYHFMKAMVTNKLKKDEQELDEFIISYNLARVFNKQQRYEEAEDLLQNSLEISRKIYGEDSPRIADVYLALGNAYAKQEIYDKAKEYYEKNLENLAKNYSKESIEYTDKLSDYGGVLIQQNKLDEGIKQILESVKNREKLKLKYDPLQSNSFIHLTTAYLQKNDLVTAKKYLDKSISSINYDYEKNDYNFDQLDVPQELVGPLYMYYEYLNALSENNSTDIVPKISKLDKLVDTLVKHIKFHFEDLNSRQVFVNDIRTLYGSRLELYDRLYKTDNTIIASAFELSERSNNTFLYEAKAEKSNNYNAITNDIYNKRQKLKGKIESSKSQLKKQLSERDNSDVIDSLKTVLTAYQDEHYKLIQNIKTNNPGYYSYVYDYPITNLPAIQKQLKDDEMVILYASSSNDQLAFSITSHKTELHNLGSLDTINLGVQEFIAYCRNPNARPKFEHNLYNLLLKPLDITQKKIHFILDGVLSTIPMEAIMDNNGDQLIRNHEISYNYSGTLITNKKEEKKGGGTVLAMAPVFETHKNEYNEPQKEYFAEVIRSGRLIPLPGSLEEVKSINNIFGGKILTQEKATKEAFFENVNGKSIIHLATHGIINELEPSLSGLMFYSEEGTPQELLVSEIIQMDLNADLVTLSACNTGSGKIINGEGVSSLGRAFSYAGCSNQILSLWSVNDNTTTKLMTNFYTNLKEGQTKANALHNAKTQYLNAAPEVLKHPYYWAGFVYYGSDTELNQSDLGLGLGLISGIGLGLLALGYLLQAKMKKT